MVLRLFEELNVYSISSHSSIIHPKRHMATEPLEAPYHIR